MKNKVLKKLKFNIHPAWINTGLVFLIMFSIYSITYNTTTLFIDPIATDLDLPRTAINMIITARSIGSICTLIVSRKFLGRFGIKRMMVVGLVGVTISMVLFSFAKSITAMYSLYFIMGLCLAYLSDLTCSAVINNWFNERASFANGIAATGSGIGGALFSIIAGFLISLLGWRLSYRILSIVSFFIAIFSISKITVYPQELGLKPIGSSEESAIVSESGVTYEEVKNKPIFWILLVVINLISYFFFVVILGIPAHLSDIGYSIEFIGSVSGLMLIFMSIMKVVLGHMYDEFPIENVVAFTIFCLMLGTIGILNVENPIYLILVIPCFAVGQANFAQSLQASSRVLFGRKDYSNILTTFMVVNTGGGLVCPLISGLAYDLTGSYNVLYKIVFILAIILLISSQIIIRKVQKEFVF